VALSDDLSRIAATASAHATGDEEVAAVIAAEPSPGERTYVCSFSGSNGSSWLVLDDDGAPVTDRIRVRSAVSIAALCEIAEEQAGGGDPDELRDGLLQLRLTEQPPNVEEIEDAALQLERTIGSVPRVASPAYLDAVGASAMRLEAALGGNSAASPFAAAMEQAAGAAQQLALDVESKYKLPLT